MKRGSGFRDGALFFVGVTAGRGRVRTPAPRYLGWDFILFGLYLVDNPHFRLIRVHYASFNRLSLRALEHSSCP